MEFTELLNLLATKIHEDEYGELYEVAVKDEEPILYLLLGQHLLRSPPHVKSAKEAFEWARPRELAKDADISSY